MRQSLKPKAAEAGAGISRPLSPYLFLLPIMPSPSQIQQRKFWTEQLKFIVGKKVVQAEMAYDEDMDAMKPVLTFDDGQKLEMLSDEEGNGPGRFAYLA